MFLWRFALSVVAEISQEMGCRVQGHESAAACGLKVEAETGDCVVISGAVRVCVLSRSFKKVSSRFAPTFVIVLIEFY